AAASTSTSPSLPTSSAPPPTPSPTTSAATPSAPGNFLESPSAPFARGARRAVPVDAAAPPAFPAAPRSLKNTAVGGRTPPPPPGGGVGVGPRPLGVLPDHS